MIQQDTQPNVCQEYTQCLHEQCHPMISNNWPATFGGCRPVAFCVANLLDEDLETTWLYPSIGITPKSCTTTNVQDHPSELEPPKASLQLNAKAPCLPAFRTTRLSAPCCQRNRTARLAHSSLSGYRVSSTATASLSDLVGNTGTADKRQPLRLPEPHYQQRPPSC